MGFADLLKHQSMSAICGKFVKSINKKYNNNIKIGEYIVERLLAKNIHIGFASSNGVYTPLYKFAKENEDFNIVFHDYEKISAYSALTNSKTTNNLGLIINTSTYGYNNIYKPLKQAHYRHRPVMLMSFYDKENESKLTKYMNNERKYMKEYYDVKQSDRFPNILEYMMMIAEMPQKGPVHVNICNNILEDAVNMDNINVIIENVKDSKIYINDKKDNKDDQDLSLLQYYEKSYEQLERSEQSKLNKK